MTKRDYLYRRIFYTLALLPVLWVEDLLFLSFQPFGVGASLLPLAVGCAAALEGATFGAGYGLLAGVFLGAQNPASAGVYLFALSALGFLCGLLHHGMKHPMAACLVVAPLCLLALSLGRTLVLALLGGDPLALLRLGGLECLTSLLFLPFIAALFWLCRYQTRHLRPALEPERSEP